MPPAGLTSDPRIVGPFSHRRTGIVVLMVLLSVMTYFDRIIIAIAGPGILKEFSLSETEMGSVYSAYLVTYALLMVPGGLRVRADAA